MPDPADSESLAMRVCVVAPFPPPYGGMGIQAEKLVRNLRAEGFQVTVAKTNRTVPRLVSRIKGVRTLTRFTLFLSDMLRALRRVDVVHILSGSYVSFWIHTAPAVVISRLYGNRILLNQRTGNTAKFLAEWGAFAKPIIRRSDTIVVPSGFLQSVFAEHGIEATIIPNIADLDLFKYRDRREFGPRLLITRHLSPLYNIPCTIRAFRILKETYPAAELGIVGTGSVETEIKKFVRELNLEGVCFYGYVPHDELPRIYDMYDICVNSSNIDNYPGSLLEAFASGLPVVSTRAGGIPYMIEHNETGLLVDLNDHNGLAQRIVHLLQNSQEARRIAGKARGIVEQNSWQSVFAQLRRLYADNPSCHLVEDRSSR